jgi:hypothetical protein
VKRAVGLGLATAVYVLAAWSVRPGFYDGVGAPQYAYVNPPPYQATVNVQPTSGHGILGLRPDGTVAGGSVKTADQPVAQASMAIPAGALAPPSSPPVTIAIAPYDVPAHVPGVTLIGNMYCFTANTTFNAGRHGTVALMWPADRPAASGVYFAVDPAGPWRFLGGRIDLGNYVWTSDADAFGCFAVGYPTPRPGGGPTVGGAVLPAITALLIAIVLLAGLPLALRRRRGIESR